MTQQIENAAVTQEVSPPAELDFTGERIVPGKTAEALFREHEERYVFAGRYVAGKDVLDVACGSGVGTSYLHKAGARGAVGMDIDPQAIAYAKAHYTDCEFEQCDATRLTLPDGCMDVVVSFETLEHISAQQEFLKECHRVLRLGGLLICSTPNREISRWSASNPFHIKEHSPSEFRDLIESLFQAAEIFGQRTQNLLSYAPRKTARRILQSCGLLDRIERFLGIGTAEPTFRSAFQNGASQEFTTHVPEFLRRPTFLIAVARKS